MGVSGAAGAVDANTTLINAAALGAMYSTCTFAELSLQPPRALTFAFSAARYGTWCYWSNGNWRFPYFPIPAA